MTRSATLWFWRDWESDVALKACSLAAQGLWMRMLCIAAQHDPTGYVSVNRVGLDPEGIARIVGTGVDEVRSLIGELSLNGVFARDQHGVIYNRRMVRDEKKAAIARKNGKLGGNPMLCNGSSFRPLDKSGHKGGLKGGLKLKPIPLTIKDSKKDFFNGSKKRENLQHFVPEDTPQWNAWVEFYRSNKKPPLNKYQNPTTLQMGRYFPTEWPPSPPPETLQEP